MVALAVEEAEPVVEPVVEPVEEPREELLTDFMVDEVADDAAVVEDAAAEEAEGDCEELAPTVPVPE